MAFKDFFEMGLFGYIFAMLGVATGVIICGKVLSSFKTKPKRMDNIIMDTFSQGKLNDDVIDPFAELDDIPSLNEEFIENDDKSKRKNVNHSYITKNDPITYSDICSCYNKTNETNFVEDIRKGEDDSYNILQQKMNQASMETTVNETDMLSQFPNLSSSPPSSLDIQNPF